MWCPCPAHGHYTKGHICCTRKKKKKFWVPNIDFIFKSALIYVTSFILFSLCFLLLQCCSEGSRSSHRDGLCVWRVKTAGRRGEIAALAPCILGFRVLPCPSSEEISHVLFWGGKTSVCEASQQGLITQEELFVGDWPWLLSSVSWILLLLAGNA